MSEDNGITRNDASGDGSTLTGTVIYIRFYNEENYYTVCDLETAAGDIHTVVGTMPYVNADDEVTVVGKWVHNAKYGRQFEVTDCQKLLPADENSILRYLASRTIKGIGPKTAKKIVEKFGEDTFEIIENHPDWLAELPGITEKKAREISEDFKSKNGIRSAMLFFGEFFGNTLSVRIYKKLGGRAVDIARENPYKLCEEIEGIGFEKADKMADKLKIPRDSKNRIMSGVLYIVTQNAYQNGHVCLPREKTAQSAASLLGVDVALADEAISTLLSLDKLKYCVYEKITYIYSKAAYNAEKYIANKTVLIDKLATSVDITDIGRFIEREEENGKLQYAALQKEAIKGALTSGVMVLTGGPGTGKTTIVRALIRIFDSMDMSVALCAPTGRAAKRLSESCVREAKTIHRLLEMTYSGEDGAGETGGFNRDETNLLEENVIIVDEASMIDNFLMCALLKAIKPGARLILIGDADQLPSVGAGNVLCDIIESGRFTTVRLTEIFRQASMSLIITNAHAINEGKVPDLSVKNNDFFFLYRERDRDIAATILDLYKNRLPKSYGEQIIDGIQVIAPSRRGESGTENLNVILQAGLNPPAKDKKEYKYKEKLFREGDRVMQIRNNYELHWERAQDGKEGDGIFNGDIGVIERIDARDGNFIILFDDRAVEYTTDLLDDLEHAYAITVHKSQGSEYPLVIIPMCGAASMLLTRNLLYTAVTRAQKMVILVGREDIVARMVGNNRHMMRYTGLYYRLAGRENA